jgi:hypothetical protein
MAEETAAEAAARARAAQRAAEAPSREAAEAAQRRASSRPTAAQASANQAAGGNYADRRNLLINQGQRAYNNAVTENATRMPEPPGGRRTGYGSPSMPARPAAAAAAESASLGSRALSAVGDAGKAALRTVGRLAGPAGVVLGSTSVANAELNTPEGRRRLAEDQANRSVSAGRREPSVITSGEAEPDAMNARPTASERSGVVTSGDKEPDDMGARPNARASERIRQVEVEKLRREAQSRAPRPNPRSTARMSPRENLNEPPVETPTERLNRISHETNNHGGRFVSVMDQSPGSEGEVARNIMNRRGQLMRELESDGMKRGGPVKKMAKGGVVSSSASSRSDGCVTKGRTKGRMV